MPSVAEIYQFDELTWPEVNEAIAMGKIPIIPSQSPQHRSPSPENKNSSDNIRF